LNAIGRMNLLDPWGHPYQYQNLTGGGGTPLQDFIGNDYNTDYDLYSLGPDGASAQVYADPTSLDDIVRSNDGGYVGMRF
jgi:general secretion pathway protein G